MKWIDKYLRWAMSEPYLALFIEAVAIGFLILVYKG